VASVTGDSGVITNAVRSDTGAAKGKLFIEAVHILGVPTTAPGTVLEAARLPQVQLNGQALQSGYDAAAGVVKLTGLNVPVGQQLQLTWRL
jgi:hypothetical protein